MGAHAWFGELGIGRASTTPVTIGANFRYGWTFGVGLVQPSPEVVQRGAWLRIREVRATDAVPCSIVGLVVRRVRRACLGESCRPPEVCGDEDEEQREPSLRRPGRQMHRNVGPSPRTGRQPQRHHAAHRPLVSRNGRYERRPCRERSSRARTSNCRDRSLYGPSPHLSDSTSDGALPERLLYRRAASAPSTTPKVHAPTAATPPIFPTVSVRPPYVMATPVK